MTPDQLRNEMAYLRAIEEIDGKVASGAIAPAEAAEMLKAAENTYRALTDFIAPKLKLVTFEIEAA